MTIETFATLLEEAKVDQQELDECGDLEERLEAAIRVADLEGQMLRAQLRDTDSRLIRRTYIRPTSA